MVDSGVHLSAHTDAPQANMRPWFGFEAYYRVQLTNEIAVTPDVQYVLNPANNTEVDSLWVFSLRVQTDF